MSIADEIYFLKGNALKFLKSKTFRHQDLDS